MKKNKQILEVDLDFSSGPLSLYKTLERFDLEPVIDADKELIELDNKISQMYDSYYEFDTHDVACWFDRERFFSEKEKMLALVERFKARLLEIGGDSFVIDDKITPLYDEYKQYQELEDPDDVEFKKSTSLLDGKGEKE